MPRTEKLIPMQIRFSADPGNLCPEAEPRLITAIGAEKIIVVNSGILFKVEGRLVGVAFQDMSVQKGEVRSGYWYRPDDSGIRTEIEDAYVSGCTNLTIARPGIWTEKRRLRAVSGPPAYSIPQLLDKVRDAATELVAFPRIRDVDSRALDTVAIERPTFRD